VPYSPGARLAKNRITTVVVSPRLNAAPVNVARGILVHELGHAIDFHCFGSRCGVTVLCECNAAPRWATTKQRSDQWMSVSYCRANTQLTAPDAHGRQLTMCIRPHAVYAFMHRYGLMDRRGTGSWRQLQRFQDASTQDNFEVRADDFAGVVLSALGDGALCQPSNLLVSKSTKGSTFVILFGWPPRSCRLDRSARLCQQ
jgi:hypothetical protein